MLRSLRIRMPRHNECANAVGKDEKTPAKPFYKVTREGRVEVNVKDLFASDFMKDKLKRMDSIPVHPSGSKADAEE